MEAYLMQFIHLEGRLGADPEIKHTNSGIKVTNLNIATTVRQNGENKTLWIRASFFDDKYDKMMEYLKKGSAVSVIGTLQIPKVYQARDGEYKTSIEVKGEQLAFGMSGKDKKEEANGDGQEVQEGQASAQAVPMDDSRDDDLPF